MSRLVMLRHSRAELTLRQYVNVKTNNVKT